VGDDDFLKRKLRKGWNQTFWTSVQRAGVIKRSPQKMKDIHGRWYYEKGVRWDWWLTTYLFFTKDVTEITSIYDEDDIPEGWTVKPTPIRDVTGDLKTWAQQGWWSPRHESHRDQFDEKSVVERPLDGEPPRDLDRCNWDVPFTDRANRYGHNW